MAGYIGNDPSKSATRIARQIYTTSGITTTFTFSSGYNAGYFDVYVNGSRQTEGKNFTASDGSNFDILNGGVGSGVTVEGVAYKAFNIASVSFEDISGTAGDLSVGGQITASTGDVGIATINSSGIDIGVGIFTGNGAGLTGVASTDNINTSTPATFRDINATGVITATAYYGSGANLTNVISGVELKSDGNSVGTAITQINFSGFGSVTAPVSGFSTVSVDRFLTIGVRSGAAVTFTIADTSFNVLNRAGGNVAINL